MFSSTRLFVAFAIITAALSAFAMFGDRASSKNTQSLLAATLSATKTGALDAGGDANGNGVINPGDRLKYSVVINNTGTDAAGVNFSDTIDANTTFVSGSVIASPVAVNENYSAIGNVSITVPAASGVLVNDLNANTGAACSVGNTCTITTAGSFLSANGSNVTLNADGSFTFNAKAGFEGADTFTYTLSNGTGLTDSATVTVNVSGMIWFVNNNAGACAANCDGRLSNPFTTLAAFNTANNLNPGGGLNPDSNDNIFVFESATQYTGAVTLRTGQKLIGQDATATLAAITNLNASTFSATFPAMNSGNATITNIGSTVTLNTNATLRGFSLNSTTNTGINDPASAITGVNTSEVNVATTTGTAIFLSSAGGTLSFTKVSANGAANGISLTNTTGSFTVSGSSSGICGGMTNIPGASTPPNAADCTGGVIQNTVGGDGTSAGNGIYLNNVQNVSLTRVRVNDNQNNGIYGVGVRGLTISNSLFNGNNGTSNSGAFEESSLHFVDLGGTVSVTNSYLGGTVYSPSITGSAYDHFLAKNTSGTSPNLALTFTNNTLGTMQGSTADVRGSAFQVVASDGTISVNASNNEITYWWGNAVQVAVQGTSASGTAAIRNNRVLQTSGALGAAGGIEVNGGNLAFDISGNRVAFTDGTAISADKNQGNTYFNGTINNNQVGYATASGGPGGLTPRGTAWASNINSGSATGTGIFAQHAGPNATTINVTNNTVQQVNGSQAMWMLLGDDVGGGGSGTLNTTITGNNIAEEGSAVNSARTGIVVQSGRVNNDTDQMCADIRTNSITNFNNRIRPNQRFNTVMRMPGYTGASNDNTAVNNYLTGRNPGTVNVTSSSTAGGGGIFNTSPAGSACPQPTTISIAALNFENESKDENLAAIVEPAATTAQPSQNIFSLQNKIYAAVGNIILTATNIKSSIIPTAQAESNFIAVAAPLAGETVTKSLGALPMNESITVQFTATVNQTPSNFFSVSNTANITAAGGININSTTATNAVVQPASIGKAFGTSFIATGNTTSLTYTITNANSIALNGLSFSETLPAGLVVNSPNGANTTCGGSVTAAQNTSSIGFSGGSIGANTTCTVKIDVKGTTEGAKTSQTNAVASTNGGAGNSASATLNVINAPTFTKAFGAATIPLNGSTNLSFTITNASQAFPINNVSFTDSLPAGLVVTAPPNLTGTCGGGTITATAGAGTISLSSATLAANTNCTFSVSVTGTAAGIKNTSATLSTTELGSTPTATASMTVLAPPAIAKAFSPVSIPSGGTSTVTLTLSNGNATALTNASFSDALVNMSAAGGAVTGTCAGTSPNTLAAGATALNFTGITVPANGNCTVAFNVTSSAAGVNPNTTGAVSSANGGTGLTSNTANLTVIAPPQITKSFTPDTVLLNGVSTLTITLSNPSMNTVALTGAGVVDNFPAGMQVDATPSAITMCGGTFAPAANATTLTISGATIPVNSSCSFTVKVKGTSLGALNNTTGAVTSTNGGTGGSASATLTVNPATNSISGKVSYGNTLAGNPSKYVSNVLMSATGASSTSTNTDSTGVYSLENLTANGQYTVTPTKTGDVSGINSFDATTVLRYLAAGQNGTLTANQLIAADTNGDSQINSFDATQILRYLSANGQQTAATGQVGNWKFFPSSRNYPSLANSLSNEDYQAVLVGEVSGDWMNAANSSLTYDDEKAGQTADSSFTETGNVIESSEQHVENSLNDKSRKIEASLQEPAATDVQISLPPSATGTMNSTIVIPVSFVNSAGGAISGFNFGVTFNPNVLMLETTAVETTGTLLNGTNPTTDTNTAGRIGISAANLNITAASGTLLNLRFKVIGTPGSMTTGSTALTFEHLTMPTVSPSFQSDTGANLATGAADGTFTVTFAPTAAAVSISGRVLTNAGRGINRAQVTMTGSDGIAHYATTNPFGYFHFTDVAAGETYVFTTRHKQYLFAPQVLNVSEDITDLNFTGLPVR